MSTEGLSIATRATTEASAALSKIEDACKRAAVAAEDLSGALSDLRAAIEPSISRALPRIRDLLIAHRAARKSVADLVEANRQHFAKPRTRIYHGIKVGLQSLPPQLMLEDKGDALIARIDRELPDLAPMLAPSERTVSTAALKLLQPEQLAQIGGVQVSGTERVLVTLPLDPEPAVHALLGARAEVEGGAQ